MKKIVYFILFALISTSAYAQHKTHLSLAAGASAGDWASLTADMEEEWGMGINVKFIIHSNDSRFSIAPGYIYFPVPKITFNEMYAGIPTEVEIDPRMHYLNLDARFAFIKTRMLNVHAIAGPGFLYYYEKINAGNSYYEGSDDNEKIKAGANLGAGVTVKATEKFGCYADITYSLIPDDWDQLLITAGLFIRIF